ncbi:DNA internalization-related competence protein ComEC/Rec2 [Enterococcus florum]|uniref:DNA internalization-related competence protein ComEC/Rec2 n=1 Tax=Enterococcus florum TaxID=2480627 RepID=A0A4P5PFZ4_9ENTE|nr:DNA internalization-related competence protein ComEC/Rec2 [Enterococcus florum]GCF94572.1 DNA internalization-related competence protein ComEC/Rec2 [Enterococcus florum]
MLYRFHWIWLVLFLLLLIRIGWTKSRELIALTFLSCLVVGVRSQVCITRLRAPLEMPESDVFKVLEDTVKVNGSSLQFIGVAGRKSYRLYYQLPSEKEQKLWLSAAPPSYVLITGESYKADSARNLGGFNALDYDYSSGIVGRVDVQNLKTTTVKGFSLHRLRYSWFMRIQKKLPQRLSSYVNALVIGYKDAFFDEWITPYKINGILHLFTLSGMHVQFYLGSFHLLLKRLGMTKESRLFVLIVIGVLFTILTGRNISVLRAVTAYLITFSCDCLGWKSSRLDQWSISLLALLLIRPLILYSVGGRLSLFFSVILVYLPQLTEKRWKQTLLFSFLAFPILIHEFSEWSITSGILTLCLVPVFQWFLLPVCTFLFVTSFGLELPSNVLFFLEKIVSLIERLISLITLPMLTIGKPSLSQLIVLLILTGVLIHRLKYKQRLMSVLVLLVLVTLSISYSPYGSASFIDVGQGDSTLIKLPFKRETFLIDTGGQLHFKQEGWQKRKQTHLSDYTVIPHIKSLGISKIDHVIITHNDADHMGELLHLSKEIKIRNLYIGKGSEKKILPLLHELNKYTKIHVVTKGDQVGQRVKFFVLAPILSKGENNDSIVTYFTAGHKRFLLSGDLEKSGEKTVIEDYPKLEADILKIGHHGSNTSTDTSFIDTVNPETAVISVGKNNRYGHPTAKTIDTLERQQISILRTDHHGMIYYRWLPLFGSGKIEKMIDFEG